jgi:OmpA-OmpF porin, OOP family
MARPSSKRIVTVWLLLFAASLSLQLNFSRPSNAASAAVRLALVNVPDDLLKTLLPEFKKQSGFEAEIVYTGNDPFAEARNGKADLVISHYGHEGVEPFVSAGLGLWPHPVFANQMALFGPSADPAHVRGSADATEAFRRIANAKKPFMVNRGAGARYVEEILWISAGQPAKGDWYINSKMQGRDAVRAANEKGAYVLWGLPPFLRLKRQSPVNLEPLVYSDPLFQRIMVSATAANPAAQAAAADQPDLKEIKSDFVPGEKTLFYDDFTDMAGDEPPPHWKVRGGTVALKVGSGIRQLTVTSEKVRLTPNIKSLPNNFTIELEVKYENPSDTRSVLYLHDKTWDGPLGPNAALRIWTAAKEGNINVALRHAVDGDIADVSVKVDDYNKPVKQAIWIQNGRLRIYINGQRAVDVNQVELPALTGLELDPEGTENSIGYRMARIAESTADFSQIIASSGRYVTHGIFFDTDSDRLKQESAPVIKLIAQGLGKNPNLKLQIEGHTDSTGDAAHNLDLSKRRAEAVKSVLVSQFGISADRLTTVGVGASKPLESNDTPSGRAQNRRVEFVKM